LERLHVTFKGGWEDMSPDKTVEIEIEALENALQNPSDRKCYEEDFWSNADVLLRAMKALQKGDKQDGQGKDYPRAS
jgi:hypothetical protein